MLKIDDAKEELKKKSYRDIQVETAWRWASRAAVSYENVSNAVSALKRVELYMLAEEYYHEAVEHAALVPTDSEDILKKVKEAVLPYALSAWESLEDLV